MKPLVRIALVGFGKIARDQHLPAVCGSSDFELVATVDPSQQGAKELPCFEDLRQLHASNLQVDAVSICTPPHMRYQLATIAIAYGWHVLLEKPPGATVSEVATLEAQACAAGVTIFSAWHSRFASAVGPARAWLATRRVIGGSIEWYEDVKRWHPGQAWIWSAKGLGVFDPGINALSILTWILPNRVGVESATVEIPSNCEAPIAARLALREGDGASIDVKLDWRQQGPQRWEITLQTDAGDLVLKDGGAVLHTVEGSQEADNCEYPSLYAHFAALITGGQSDIDLRPFQLVADALMIAERRTVAAFVDGPPDYRHHG